MRPQRTAVRAAAVVLTRSYSLVSLALAVLPAGCGEFVLPGEETLAPDYEYRVDEFEQSPVAARDILWMIDTTHSMVEEAAVLAPHFKTFIDALAPYGISYQVGIVTSDVQIDGARLQGTPWIISPDTPDAEEAFAQNVTSIINSIVEDVTAGPEEGLEAIVTALSEELQQAGAPNYGFLRADAGLSIIAVSDSDDVSSGEVSDYEDALIALKGGGTGDLINFSAIVGPGPDGCQGGNGTSATFGERYIEIATDFDGEIESICDEDLTEVIARIGQSQLQKQTRFTLGAVPVEGSLVVKVNTSRVTEGEDWVYEAAGNAVVFLADHVPDFGAIVVASYSYEL